MKEEKFAKYPFILFLILAALLILSYISKVYGGQPFSFYEFLTGLSNVPNVVLENFDFFTIENSWGVFDFLRNFINLFGNIISLIVYFCSYIWQCVQYIFYLLQYFFLRLF